MHRRLFLGLLAILMAGQMACVDVNSAGGGNTALYVHNMNGGTPQIQVFTDVESVFTTTGDLTPTKTLTSTFFDQASPLAWGGLVLDSSGNRLYLVGETGTVVRIDRLRNQVSGDIPSTSVDVVSFTLGNSSDRLAGGKFGQATFDETTKTLYVIEANASNDTQVWTLPSPSSISSGTTVPRQLVTLTPGDKTGSGMAAGGGYLYGYFNEGNRLDIANSWVGPRLRRGDATSFPLYGSVLGGDESLLGLYGSMALDTGNKVLYFARHNDDSNVSGTPAPLLAFSVGQFTTGAPNQAPDRVFGSGTALHNIRVLAHAGNRDWLGALTSVSDNPVNVFWLWKAPSGGSAPVKLTLPGAGIKGLAFDGNN